MIATAQELREKRRAIENDRQRAARTRADQKNFLYCHRPRTKRKPVADSRIIGLGEPLGRANESRRCKKDRLRKGARPQCASDGIDRAEAVLPIDFEPVETRHAVVRLAYALRTHREAWAA